jgi:hypothetical protein
MSLHALVKAAPHLSASLAHKATQQRPSDGRLVRNSFGLRIAFIGFTRRLA